MSLVDNVGKVLLFLCGVFLGVGLADPEPFEVMWELFWLGVT
jgi:hypothetical protein